MYKGWKITHSKAKKERNDDVMEELVGRRMLGIGKRRSVQE